MIREWRARRRRARELARLRALPRRTPTVTRLLGPPLEIVDAESFLWTLPDVIRRGAYRFVAAGDAPRILDGGANVGLASIDLKRRYPRARITAFEPDPELAARLRRNLAAFGCGDVEVVEAALWTSEGEAPFLPDGADGGRLAAPGEGTFAVPCVRLRDRLAESVDLLKLDVEGAEVELLRDCADRLGAVRHLFVEYHGANRPAGALQELLSTLDAADFAWRLEAGGRTGRPFEELAVAGPVADTLVQIYARRRDGGERGSGDSRPR